MGRPIATVPVRRPPRPYGAPKPVPFPPGPRPIPQEPPKGIFGPPRPIGVIPPRRGYGPQYTSQYKPNNPYYQEQSSSFSSGGSSFASKPLGPLFNPNEPNEPYAFEPVKGIIKNPGPNLIGQSSTVLTSGTTTGVQQHVHHHFHHGDDASVKVPIVVNPTSSQTNSVTHGTAGTNFIGSGGFTPISSVSGYKEGASYLQNEQNSAIYGGLGNYASNVKPVYETYSPQTFESSGTQSFSVTGSYGTTGGSYGGNSVGASVGQYGNSSPFYKKELNLSPHLNGNSIQSAYGQSAYADKYQTFQAQPGRVENYDCVCVPLDQCPAQHVIGRKDDLYLPLDPRSLKTDIVAEEVVLTDGNGTMTLVRIPKNATAQNETAEIKKVSKRDTEEKNIKEDENPEKSKVEAVSTIIVINLNVYLKITLLYMHKV